MASTKKTPTLQLETYNASPLAKQVLFEEFRLAIANSDDSNMTKLDDFALETKEELSKKASKDVATTTKNGLMSSTDKTRVDNMWNGQAGNADVVAHNANPDAHPDKLQLNGTTTNVNFKKNEIVQDGLVGSWTNTDNEFLTGVNIVLENNFEIVTECIINGKGTLFNQVSFSPFTGFELSINSERKPQLEYCKNGVLKYVASQITDKLTYGKKYIVKLSKINGVFRISFDDKIFIVEECAGFVNNIAKFKIGGSGTNNLANNKYAATMLYTKQLTSVEIQHSLSVLNNTASINAIETTDSEGHKTSFLLSSDTDHVMTRTGHTEEERYTALLSKFSKKFTSTGEDITVENGIENQRVLSALIKGNTLKNYIASTAEYSKRASDDATIEGDYLLFSSSTKEYNYQTKDYTLKTGVTYTAVFFNASSEFSTGSAYIRKGDTALFSLSFDRNILAKQFIPEEGSTYKLSVYQLKPPTPQKIAMMIIEGSYTEQTVPRLFYGLGSTKAIISNNGLKYPFYASAEDKAIGTVIALGGFDTIRDTLEQLEDGSGIYTKNTEKYTFTGDEFVTLLSGFPPTDTNFARFTINIPHRIATRSAGMCDKADWVNLISTTTNKFAFGGSDAASGATVVHCIIEKAKLSTVDAEGLKTWLKTNPVTVRYQLYTPVITFIDKELMPVITTEETNIFSTDSAVKPNELEITIAVDKVLDLETKLNNLNSLVVSLQLQLDSHENQL